MKPVHARHSGFTLIELLVALLILAALALMSYRGLGAILDARDHVGRQTERWRHVAAFFARFERDVRLAAPRPVRTAAGLLPAFLGRPEGSADALLEFSRFAASGGVDTPRRLGYRLNTSGEIELWLWSGLDIAPTTAPAKYAVLRGVSQFELQYLNTDLAWANIWPLSPIAPPLPRAVRVRLVLESGEELVRVFALNA